MKTTLPTFAGAAALLLASTVALAQTISSDISSAMQWRQVGPFRAGWSTVAKGVPNQPDTFYFGAAGGGVWKSSDAGSTWHPVFDSVNAANIGAMAIAPSDPRVIYVGTGQVTSRYDIASGDGVYKSTNGGETWQRAGLEKTRAFGSILVDPRNADTVLAAAFGHAFGPNSERGVFRSTDGGRTYTLFLRKGGRHHEVARPDLAMDPADPDFVVAAVWHQRFWPWLSYFMPEEDSRSGVFISKDAGKTWKRVVGGGWPADIVGDL